MKRERTVLVIKYHQFNELSKNGQAIALIENKELDVQELDCLTDTALLWIQSYLSSHSFSVKTSKAYPNNVLMS